MRIRGRFATALAVTVLLVSSSAIAEGEEEETAVIVAGSEVSIEYTLTLDGGDVADTNVGGTPLTYQQGSGRILPALEAELLGLAVGATKEVDLTAEQGYGPVNDEFYDTVDKKLIPEDARSVGTTLVAQAPDGQQRPVRVHEVKEDEIVLDLNHPLAGKALHFAIKILSIE
jgi:FKBP-type peptidyl-prolyl cis-trans isomerase 2